MRKRLDIYPHIEVGGNSHTKCNMQGQRQDSEVVLCPPHLRDFMAFTTLEIYNIATVLSLLTRGGQQRRVLDKLTGAHLTLLLYSARQHAQVLQLAFGRGKHCTFNSRRIKDKQGGSPLHSSLSPCLCLQYRRPSPYTTQPSLAFVRSSV